MNQANRKEGRRVNQADSAVMVLHQFCESSTEALQNPLNIVLPITATTSTMNSTHNNNNNNNAYVVNAHVQQNWMNKSILDVSVKSDSDHSPPGRINIRKLVLIASLSQIQETPSKHPEAER